MVSRTGHGNTRWLNIRGTRQRDTGRTIGLKATVLTAYGYHHNGGGVEQENYSDRQPKRL